MKKIFATQNDLVLFLLRLTLGLVFFPHGAQKMLGWFGGGGYTGTMQYFISQGIPAFFAFLAIMAEFLGSLGLILGLLTRVAAFGIACVMVVAVSMVHWPHGFFMNWSGQQGGEGFEYHVLVLVIAAILIWKGGGAYSIDQKIAKKK